MLQRSRCWGAWNGGANSSRTMGLVVGTPAQGQADGHHPQWLHPAQKLLHGAASRVWVAPEGTPYDVLVSCHGGCHCPPPTMPGPTLPQPSGGDACPQFLLVAVGGLGLRGGSRGPLPESSMQEPPAPLPPPSTLLPVKGESRAGMDPMRGCWHLSRHPVDSSHTVPFFPRVSQPQGPPTGRERGFIQVFIIHLGLCHASGALSLT